MPTTPAIRIQPVNDAPIRTDGDHVLYWMIAHRRRRANFGLQRAAELSRELGKPLVVLEALRCGHRWASDRFHAFVLAGMADNRADFADSGVTYHPYVETKPGAGKGLLLALAERACAVVTDDFPCFFLPHMVASAGKQVGVRMEQVDSNGLLPMRVADKVFGRAFDFRRFLQKALPAHMGAADFPVGDPIAKGMVEAKPLPKRITDRWPAASEALLAGDLSELAKLPIDHTVKPVATVPGGPKAGGAVLRRFLKEKLKGYGELRNHPDLDAASGLSPYLHFGHVGVHQVFAGLAAQEQWQPSSFRAKADGQRGWFGMSEGGEAFAEELVVWRELGYNYCWQRDDYGDYESLPEWAKATLAEHATDPREHVYSLEELDRGRTHDRLWNAAQNQLREEGRIHNYLRMLWGKKVLQWTPSPKAAFDILVELNNRYALDGRNPNSYTGISWVLGRYDRPWAPKRDVFGVIRYMSSDNTVRKVKTKAYIERWSPAEPTLFPS